MNSNAHYMIRIYFHCYRVQPLCQKCKTIPLNVVDRVNHTLKELPNLFVNSITIFLTYTYTAGAMPEVLKIVLWCIGSREPAA